jgi:deoxyribodipyrimidine photo-lyase
MIIHWFRRDLRLSDNPALSTALRDGAGAVVPVFILDDTLLKSRRVGPARVIFLLDSLHALDAELRARGSRLIVRHGPPAAMLAQLIADTGADAVYCNRDYTPFARARDAAVEEQLNAGGVKVKTFQDLMIWEPDVLRTKTGQPYTVYTPYARQWRARIEADRAPISAESRLPAFAPVPESIEAPPIPTAEDLGIESAQYRLQGGEQAGLERLRNFARLDNPHGIANYHQQRDLMAQPATSRLSAYLHLGCVSTRACLRAALQAGDKATGEARNGVEGWIGELAWHDFYMQILYHFPYVLRGAFKREFDDIAWENDETLFAAWCEGRTGYPIVDAAMRQLNSEAWMHNRARMIVASFLVKDLLVDWRWGEEYFLQQLVDGDHAANNGGWQWVAGTGTDAQPYFRIFNPVSQGEKFDTQGDYVRRYVPELARVPNRYIHAPWTMPADEQRRAGVRIGHDYPAPIVDHAVQRARALAMYKQTRRDES